MFHIWKVEESMAFPTHGRRLKSAIQEFSIYYRMSFKVIIQIIEIKNFQLFSNSR